MITMTMMTMGQAWGRKLPEVSSTILQMQKLYSLQPPHDRTLYDILQVPSNATLAQIQKSYRRLSRLYHPDKLILPQMKTRKKKEEEDGSNDDGTVSEEENNEDDEDDDHYDHYRRRQEEGWTRIQRAYDVLREDRTRLLYHNYGLVDTSWAVVLLTGPYRNLHNQKHSHRHVTANPLQQELLLLMGYDPTSYSLPSTTTKTYTSPSTIIPPIPPSCPPPPPPPYQQQQSSLSSPSSSLSFHQQHRNRVLLIAARLVERIRPLVEGTIDDRVIRHMIAEECDRLKTLPLGAQILRCIGRAYRHAGQDYLRRHHPSYQEDYYQDYYQDQDHYQDHPQHYPHQHSYDPYTPPLPPPRRRRRPPSPLAHRKLATNLSIGMRRQWRQAKYYWTAIVASGRVLLTEHVYSVQQQQKQKRKQRTKSSSHDTMDSSMMREEDSWIYSSDSDMDDMNDIYGEVPTKQQWQEQERDKARQAMLQSLQIDALWKVSKIDLDQTIREACDMILRGEYFFFPSHQSASYHPPLGSSSSSSIDWSDPTIPQQRIEEDGWVTSLGRTMDTHQARMRAAAAMKLVGDIMVQCSKEGTSWK